MNWIIFLMWAVMVAFTGCLGKVTDMPDDWFGIKICCIVISTIILAISAAKVDSYSKRRLSGRERWIETKLYFYTAIVAAIILITCCIVNCAHLYLLVWMISLIGISIHRITHNEFV